MKQQPLASPAIIVQRMYELFAQNDEEGIREIFDTNIQWNQAKGFPEGGQYIGADAIFEQVFGQFRKKWSRWEATIHRTICLEDSVFVWGTYFGTYKATGRSMQADFACEYIVRNEKIIAFNQCTDTFLIAQAMGLTAY
jgi:ketosteroid isomerase-like protein